MGENKRVFLNGSVMADLMPFTKIALHHSNKTFKIICTIVALKKKFSKENVL